MLFENVGECWSTLCCVTNLRTELWLDLEDCSSPTTARRNTLIEEVCDDFSRSKHIYSHCLSSAIEARACLETNDVKLLQGRWQMSSTRASFHRWTREFHKDKHSVLFPQIWRTLLLAELKFSSRDACYRSGIRRRKLFSNTLSSCHLSLLKGPVSTQKLVNGFPSPPSPWSPGFQMSSSPDSLHQWQATWLQSQ